jgi:ADP-ribose pyrophosphatase
MHLEKVGEKILCSGIRISLLNRRYKLDDNVIDRDVVHFGEAVAVIPVKDDGNIVMIRQFRIPVEEWILEIPAGRVEKGEGWIEAAKRELQEEAGYIAGSLSKIVSVCVSPGYSDEIIHISIARDLRKVKASPEPTEIISVIEMSLDEALNKLLNSSFADCKTLLSLLLYKDLIS